MSLIASNLTPKPMGIPSNSPTRAMELRLMHHYTRTVCYLMPNCSGQPSREMWENKIPQLSFAFSIVLDPVLALAAMHLHSQTPEDAQLPMAISYYLDRTLTRYREAILETDSNIAEPLFVAAVILSNMTWLLSHRRSEDSSAKLPIQAYHMLRGVGALYLRKAGLLTTLGYQWFMLEEPVVMPDDIPDEVTQKLAAAKEDLEALLSGFKIDTLSESEQSMYQNTVDYLLWLYKACLLKANSGALHRYIATMAVRQQPGYLELLEKHDPLAMALFARCLALLRLVDFRWWLHGCGDYEVLKRDMHIIRQLMPTSCRWAMSDPFKSITVDSEISSS